MKVAVCISGQPRFVERGYSTIYPYLIENLDADVFIHTWYDKDKIGEYYIDFGWNKNNIGKIEEGTDQKVLDLYKPVSYIVEPQKKFVVDHIANSLSAPNSLKSFSMFYSIYEANRLKKEYEVKNNFVYDWVIRIRFDLYLFGYFELSQKNNSYLYVIRKCSNNILYDTFAYSSSSIMDIYSNTFLNITELYKEVNYNEGILTKHISDNNIKTQDPYYPVGLVRKDNVCVFSPETDRRIILNLR